MLSRGRLLSRQVPRLRSSLLPGAGLTSAPRWEQGLPGARHFSEAAEATEVPPTMTSGQIAKTAGANGIGMVAFGFVDNFVMITIGDTIDANLGATLGLSAMAAAGIGNAFSDVCGHYCGDSIEAFAVELGVEEPPLTDEQKVSPTYSRAKSHGGAIGLTIGCILGMCPLLWLGNRKTVCLNKEEQELYDAVFVPWHVDLACYQDIMEKGKRRTAKEGEAIIEIGKPLDKVVMLTRGACHAVKASGTTEAVYCAVLSAQALPDDKLENRGSIIGGSRLLQRAMDFSDKNYGSNIVAQGPVSYVEWDVTELGDFCEENSLAKDLFWGHIHMDLRRRVKKGQKGRKKDTSDSAKTVLRDVLEGVIDDAYVSKDERMLVNHIVKKYDVSDEDFNKIIFDLGWNSEDWARGHQCKGRHDI